MSEREDLENLIKSPGWQRVQQWATSEWTTSVARHSEMAANETDDIAALNKLRQVLAAKKAVQLVVDWPERRLAELTTKAAQAERVPSLSRGGL